jgi:hypothetical protein
MPIAIAQESIDFQSDKFFKELTLLVSEMKKQDAKKLVDSEYLAGLQKTVKDHTGLTISIHMGAYGPAVEIPSINKNNALINAHYRDFASSADGIRMINEAGGAIRGTVNLKTGKVGGAFSDIVHKVYLPVAMFSGTKFLAEEIAAPLLHELGHLITYYEYMTRTVTSNQALAGLSKALDQSGTIAEREAVLVSVKKALNLTELDAKALAQSTDKKVVEVVVVSQIAQAAESEIGTNIYDFNTWEYLSDQFAARHGAGRYLVTALEKIYKSSFNISFRSSVTYFVMEAVKLALVVGSFWLPPVAQIGFLLIAMDSMGDGSYDRPGARFLRIRNQIVEALKDKRLSKEDVQQLSEDLDAVDEVLATVKDREQFFGLVWNLFSRNARKRMSQEAMAKEIEAYAANNLFVESMKLRQLGRAAA